MVKDQDVQQAAPFPEVPAEPSAAVEREGVSPGWEENENLIAQFQMASEGEVPGIMSALWERNQGLIRQTVHRVTGLSERDDGYEDMLQQAHCGVYAYHKRKGQGRQAPTGDTGGDGETESQRRGKGALGVVTIRIPRGGF